MFARRSFLSLLAHLIHFYFTFFVLPRWGMFPFRSRHSEALHHLFMDFINENTVFPHQLHGTVSWSFARTSGFSFLVLRFLQNHREEFHHNFSSSPFSLFLAFNELLRVASSLLFFFSLISHCWALFSFRQAHFSPHCGGERIRRENIDTIKRANRAEAFDFIKAIHFQLWVSMPFNLLTLFHLSQTHFPPPAREQREREYWHFVTNNFRINLHLIIRGSRN